MPFDLIAAGKSLLSHAPPGIQRRANEVVAAFTIKESFKYEALPGPTRIRLLDLQPGNDDAVIECNIRVVDLATDPEYTALSYTWKRDRMLDLSALPMYREMYRVFRSGEFVGDPESHTSPGVVMGLLADALAEVEHNYPQSRRTILCNGKKLEIFESLYHALLQLRSSHPGTYWIDAVCINQADDAEKEVQIQMMGRIYSSAQLVRVWLGRGRPPINQELREILAEDDVQIRPRPRRGGHDEVAESVYYLVTRKWFRRLWVLQEARLAREIQFQLGDLQFSSKAMLNALNWVHVTPEMNPISLWDLTRRSKNPDAQSLGTFNAYVDYIGAIPRIIMPDNEFAQKKWTLKEYLLLARGRPPTDQRDVVYAGLGVVREESLMIKQDLLEECSPTLADQVSRGLNKGDSPGLWPQLRSDLRADTPEVFLNLAACILSQPRPMDLLSLSARAQLPHKPASELQTVPSWIPSPNGRDSRFTVPLISQSCADTFAACLSPKYTANPKISLDRKTLHVDACLFDTVESVWDSNLERGALETHCMTLIASLPDVYEPRREPILKAIALVLMIGENNAGTSPEELLIEGLARYVEHLRGVAMGPTPYAQEKGYKRTPEEQKSTENQRDWAEETYAKLRARFADLTWRDPEQPAPLPKSENMKSKMKAWKSNVTGQKQRSAYEQFRRWWLVVSGARQIFLTRKGSIGLGPWGVKAGDTVTLVPGGAVPYVFATAQEKEKDASSIQGSYTLVGEAYVEGVMHGEVEETAVFERIAIV